MSLFFCRCIKLFFSFFVLLRFFAMKWYHIVLSYVVFYCFRLLNNSNCDDMREINARNQCAKTDDSPLFH